METLAIQGRQWGDEGKGKITDYFASKADIVVRSQGGNNAGHTIQHNGKRFALRLLPSGILNPSVVNVLADGMVIDLSCLAKEIDNLVASGHSDFNLIISKRATLLLPYHIELDKAREEALGKNKIGTTKNGIGPCYEDKAARLSLRAGDLAYPKYVKERLESILPLKNLELKAYGAKTYTVEEIREYLNKYSDLVLPRLTDTSNYLQKALNANKKVLFEGAQGAMLCLTYGTFPFVTSSSPLANAIPSNAGLPDGSVAKTCGIVKAYTTRVGAGPFPSEIEDPEIAQIIRDKGHEYGTVTGRARRIGWLDAAQLKYVASITGAKHAALMLTDVLSVVKTIKICTKYQINGIDIDYRPSSLPELYEVTPVYEELPSWTEDISSINNYEDLPENCKNYIRRIEELTGLSLDLISVGPDKNQTIIRKEIF